MKKHKMVILRYFGLNRSLNELFASTCSNLTGSGSTVWCAMASCSNLLQMALGLRDAALGLEPQRRLGHGLDDADDEQGGQSLRQVHAAPVEVRKNGDRENARDGEADGRHELIERHVLRTLGSRDDLGQIAQGNRELSAQAEAENEKRIANR